MKYIKTYEELNFKQALMGGALAASVAVGGYEIAKNYDKASLEKTEKIGNISFNDYDLMAKGQSFDLTISSDFVIAAHWDETEDDGTDRQGNTKTKTVNYYGIVAPEGTKEIYFLKKFFGGFYASSKPFPGSTKVDLSKKSPQESKKEYDLYGTGWLSGVDYIIVNKGYHDGEEFTLGGSSKLQATCVVDNIHTDVYIFGRPRGGDFSGGGATTQY